MKPSGVSAPIRVSPLTLRISSAFIRPSVTSICSAAIQLVSINAFGNVTRW